MVCRIKNIIFPSTVIIMALNADYKAGLQRLIIANDDESPDDYNARINMIAGVGEKGKLAKYSYTKGNKLGTEGRRDIAAKLGASKEINLERRRLDALTNPEVYLTNKAVDLTVVNNDALNHYVKVAEEFKELDLDDEESERKAKDAYEEYKKRRMAIHRKNYPDEITMLAEKTKSR